MPKKSSARRIHIQVTPVTLKEDVVSRSEFEGFVNNMAHAYNVVPAREGNTYHIHATDQGGRFRIMGHMGETFEHLGHEYHSIVEQLAKTQGKANIPLDANGKPIVSVCAQIKSPSLVDTAPVLETLNVLFARYKVGVYFEAFPGGIVLYIENRLGWNVVAKMVDPAYIQFKEQNRELLTKSPLEYLRLMRTYLRIDAPK